MEFSTQLTSDTMTKDELKTNEEEAVNYTAGDVGETSGIPKYQSHKVVEAFKIKDVVYDRDLAAKSGRESDGGAVLVPEDPSIPGVKVDYLYLKKHKAKAGGYFVRYQDGYESWSPAGAFEKGYALIDAESSNLLEPLDGEWKRYKREGVSEMRPYVKGEDLSGVSLSDEYDPETDMGMIARNPDNHDDMWYVARAYFEDNLKPVE